MNTPVADGFRRISLKSYGATRNEGNIIIDTELCEDCALSFLSTLDVPKNVSAEAIPACKKKDNSESTSISGVVHQRDFIESSGADRGVEAETSKECTNKYRLLFLLKNTCCSCFSLVCDLPPLSQDTIICMKSHDDSGCTTRENFWVPTCSRLFGRSKYNKKFPFPFPENDNNICNIKTWDIKLAQKNLLSVKSKDKKRNVHAVDSAASSSLHRSAFCGPVEQMNTILPVSEGVSIKRRQQQKEYDGGGIFFWNRLRKYSLPICRGHKLGENKKSSQTNCSFVSLKDEKQRRKKNQRRKHHGTSYAFLLAPSKFKYDPYALDNLRFKQGPYHTIIAMEGYITSIIPELDPAYMREELNKQFHQMQPSVHRTMSLSKLRSLKSDLFGLLDSEPELDLSTVASAWVYFERLVLFGVVDKSNRKLYAGACLLLSFKFNQSGDSRVTKNLIHLFCAVDRQKGLSPPLLCQAEFTAFVLLQFSLIVSLNDVLVHILQYLESKDLSFEEMYTTPESALLMK